MDSTITEKTMSFTEEAKEAVRMAYEKYPFLKGKRPSQVAKWVFEDWLKKEYLEASRSRDRLQSAQKYGVEDGKKGTTPPKAKPQITTHGRFLDNRNISEKFPILACNPLY